MQITPITTRPLTPPKDDLFDVLDTYLKEIRDGDIICIASKVISIHKGRCIHKDDVTNKDDLIISEADFYLPRSETPGGHALHTITQGNLAVSAGIDASNGNDYFILWPKNPTKSAQEIHTYLCQKFDIEDLGIVITDSRSLPLRYGVIGCAIGVYGFNPLKNYAGTKDIFGKTLAYEQSNHADGLAAAAVLAMGEGQECKPICTIKNAPDISFTTQATIENLKIKKVDDIYHPLLKNFLKNI